MGDFCLTFSTLLLLVALEVAVLRLVRLAPEGVVPVDSEPMARMTTPSLRGRIRLRWAVEGLVEHLPRQTDQTETILFLTRSPQQVEAVAVGQLERRVETE